MARPERADLARRARNPGELEKPTAGLQRTAAAADGEGVTAARQRSRPDPSIPTPFRDGTFALGEPEIFRVVDNDYPTEYAAADYLAVATLGRPLAVGSVHLSIPMTETPSHRDEPAVAWTVHELDLAIMPGRGVWLLAPFFETWRQPVRHTTRARAVIGQVLGRDPATLPLSVAYLPVLGCEIVAPRPDSVGPQEVYSPTLFADPLAGLRPSASPQDADALVAEILDAGPWLDNKSARHLDSVDAIPAWLADLLPGYDEID